MWLLFTDLVAKYRTPNAVTYRSTLTYCICLAEDVITLLAITLLNHFLSKGHVIDLVHFGFTITRAILLLLVVILNIYFLSYTPEISSESLLDGGRPPYNGGYGTIPRENGKVVDQTEPLPRPPSSTVWTLLKYTWSAVSSEIINS
jgi:hypothetical protein